MVDRHNAAVAEMEGVAAAFNDQLRGIQGRESRPGSELTHGTSSMLRGALAAPRSFQAPRSLNCCFRS